MLSFTFPRNKVAAALPFAGVQDIRYYLNGCLFTAHGASVLCVATDWHRLTILHESQEDVPADLAVIVPGEELARAVKAHGKSPLDLVFQVHDKAAEDQPRKVRILAAGGGTVIECDAIDGKFPDWQKVVPGMPGCFTRRGFDRDAARCSGINAAYISDYAKAGKALGQKNPVLRMRQTHFGASILVQLAGAPDFLSVLMPAREDPPELPEWIAAPAPAAKVEPQAAAEPEELRHAA